MRLARRGLTVIELVLILVAIGLIAFFLLRLRGRDAAPPVAADTSAALIPDAAPTATPAVGALTLAAPLDSTAAPGAVLDVRVRGAAAGAVVRFEAEGGGRVEPASDTTGTDGEAAARWTIGASGAQTLRATTDGGAAPLTVTVQPTAGGAGAR